MRKGGRGNFTDKSIAVFEKFFGYKPDGDEARLFVYLQYVMVNSQQVECSRVTGQEIMLIDKWVNEGYLYWHGKKDGYKHLRCTPEFWEIMSQVVYYAYVLKGADYDIEQNHTL